MVSDDIPKHTVGCRHDTINSFHTRNANNKSQQQQFEPHNGRMRAPGHLVMHFNCQKLPFTHTQWFAAKVIIKFVSFERQKGGWHTHNDNNSNNKICSGYLNLLCCEMFCFFSYYHEIDVYPIHVNIVYSEIIIFCCESALEDRWNLLWQATSERESMMMAFLLFVDLQMIYCSSMISNNKKNTQKREWWCLKEREKPFKKWQPLWLYWALFCLSYQPSRIKQLKCLCEKLVFHICHCHISLVHSSGSFPYFFTLHCMRLPLTLLFTFKFWIK